MDLAVLLMLFVRRKHLTVRHSSPMSCLKITTKIMASSPNADPMLFLNLIQELLILQVLIIFILLYVETVPWKPLPTLVLQVEGSLVGSEDVEISSAQAKIITLFMIGMALSYPLQEFSSPTTQSLAITPKTVPLSVKSMGTIAVDRTLEF